jgi:hypothetical protein
MWVIFLRFSNQNPVRVSVKIAFTKKLLTA